MNRHIKPKRNSRVGGWLSFITALVVVAVCALAIANRSSAATTGSRQDRAFLQDECIRQEQTTATRQPDTFIETRYDQYVDDGFIDHPAENDRHPPLQNADDAWMLALVNARNPLPMGFAPPLKTLANGLKFDERAIDELNAMLSAARRQGLSPVVSSAYRTMEKQQSLFDGKVLALIALGMDPVQADTEARKHVAYPGTSEHNLGLAADIVSLSYQHLDGNQANTPEVKWLHEHCAEYGFILRYPEEKEEITGIVYEPWHFRYVGVEAATAIMDGGLCLEEYLF